MNFNTLLLNCQEAEGRFDLDALLLNLRPIWKNIGKPPDISSFTVEQSAEVYRLISYLLIFYGQSSRDSAVKINGKHFLDKALEIFVELKKNDKVYLTQNLIAYYHNERGEFSKSEQILEKCETYYCNDKTHYNYLYAQVIRIMILQYSREFESAKQVIEDNTELIYKYAPPKIRGFFCNQAGAVYHGSRLFDEAINFYQQSIDCAKLLKSERATAISKHLMAKVFREQKKYTRAFQTIDTALAISQSLNDYGWLARFTTSKAQMCDDIGETGKALSIINKSIFYFRSGEDYIGYASALWSRIKILTKLRRDDDARLQFNELIKLVSEKCDQSAKIFYIEAYKRYCESSVSYIEDNNIYRVESLESEQKGNELTTLFSLPRNVAKHLFGIDERCVVQTKKETMIAGEYAVFLLDDKYFCAQLIKKNSWFLKEISTLKNLPVENVKVIRKINKNSYHDFHRQIFQSPVVTS